MVYRGLRTVSLSMTHTQQASSSFSLSSPLSLSSVAQKARDNKCVCACVSKYVWLQEATENADWAVCMHVSIFVSLCLCMLILLCVCVWVWKWLSRRYWWHPFQHWFTTAETHKSLLSAALILSCSLCHSHSTCCHLAQLLMNLYTRRKWI